MKALYPFVRNLLDGIAERLRIFDKSMKNESAVCSMNNAVTMSNEHFVIVLSFVPDDEIFIVRVGHDHDGLREIIKTRLLTVENSPIRLTAAMLSIFLAWYACDCFPAKWYSMVRDIAMQYSHL